MKAKLCWMTICLLVASSSVTAQVRSLHQTDQSPIKEFLGKASRIQQEKSSFKKVADNDLLTGLSIYYPEENEWLLGTRVKMEYESGRMITQVTEILADDVWSINDRTVNTYSNGLLTQEYYEEFNDFSGELEPYERYTYSYANSIIQEVLYEDWVEDGWITGYKDSYLVINGQISEGITYYWNDEEEAWEAMMRFMVEEENDTVIVIYQLTDGQGWVNETRDLYPNMTIEDLYNFEFNYLQNVEFALLLNDNQYPDYLSQEWDGEDWVNLEEQYTTIYNLPNQQPDKKYINVLIWDDDQWNPYTSWVQYYNGKVNPDSTVLSIFAYDVLSETEKWVVFMKEIYTYNTEDLFDEVISSIYPTSSMGFSYKYKFEWNGVSTGVEKPEKPASFKLNPAYPNPFNPTTNITYSMEKAGDVRIEVYDMLGRLVTTLVQGVKTAGQHHVLFDANNNASGIYIVRMTANGFQKNQLITLLK